MDIRLVTRETVSTDAIECVELLAVKTPRTPEKRLDYLYVVRDSEQNFGVLDAFGVCGIVNMRNEIVWFAEAATVEGCVSLYADFVRRVEADVQKAAEVPDAPE
jgi:hypothetical protein